MEEQNLNLIPKYNYLEKLNKLNEIAKLVNSAIDLDEVLKLILQQGIQLLDVSYGDLWLVEKQTGDLLLLYSTHRNKLPKGTKRIKKGYGVCGWVVQNKRPAIISAVEWDKRYNRLLSEMKSELTFPLFFEKDVLGVMNFESEKENAFSGYQEELFNALAEHAVIAIRNAKMLEREKGFRNIDRAILDSNLNLESTLSALIEEGLKLLETKKGQILLFDGKETLQLVASIPKEKIGEKLSIHECVSGKAVKEKRTIYVENVSEEPLYQCFLGEDIVAEMAAPLISNGEILGVFNIETSYQFSDNDRRLLKTLAGQAAIAIKNAQLVEDLQATNLNLFKKERLVNAFKEIDDTIIDPNIDFEETLRLILGKGLDLLGAEKGQLLLREYDEFVIKATIGDVCENSIKSVKIDEGIWGYAAKEKKPQIVSDVSKDKRYIGVIKGMGSELVYPLLDDGKLVAIFDAESPNKNFFTKEHVKILDSIKNQIIMAIQNAELQEVIKNLGEIISGINTAKNLDELLVKILDTGLNLIKVHNGQLLVVDEATNELVRKVTKGEYDEKKAKKYSMNEKSVCSWVVKHNKTVRIPDVAKDDRYIGYLKHMRSELAVPLLANGTVLGVLNTESPELDFFTEQHEKILRLLANSAALAVKNAKSREQIERLNMLKNMGEYNERLLHWIGNKASPILGCANRVIEDIETGTFEPDLKKSIEEDLQVIRENSTALLDIKKEFIGVTQDLIPRLINLHDILEKCARDIPKEINLKLKIERNIPEVKADEKAVENVISNILQNALDAMEEVEQKELQIALRQDLQHKKLILEISDNGCGINQEDLGKIFNMYFTKKSKGTGIGLSLSRELIRAMGGEISVKSEEFTTFTIELPNE